MLEKLKPCPFCGAKAIIHHDLRYPKWSDAPVTASEVICINYKCPIYKADNTYYLSDEDAIKAWNRRAESGELHLIGLSLHLMQLKLLKAIIQEGKKVKVKAHTILKNLIKLTHSIL